MKLAILGLAAGAALLLAGCTSSPEGDPSTSPSPTSTVVADGSTSSPAPTVGNLDDPLCAAAKDNIDAAMALQSKTSDLTTMIQDPTFLTSGDPSALNQWGDDMLTLTASTKSFYQLGVEQTAGEDINADFVALGAFVQNYSIALAQVASDAKSNTDFVASIQTMFSSDDITSAAKAAPAAAQNVATYLGTRCGLTG